jgi:DNA polymerase-3 subunit delta'
MIYPWLSGVLEELTDRQRRDRLPHAMLFAGQGGLGKLQLAKALVHQLLCVNMNSCGDCKMCRLLAVGSHPDFKLIEPGEDSRQIKIEQIRKLTDWVNQTAQMGAQKIAILNPAHAMNRNSANALLKAMEEPPANTHLILISDDPARLLATIRSRAQIVQVSVPQRSVAIEWLRQQDESITDWDLLLRLADGSPLYAIEKSDEAFLVRRKQISAAWCDLLNGNVDVVTLVDSLSKVDPEEVLVLGMTMFADVARHGLNAGDDTIQNSDLVAQIMEIAEHMDSSQALAAVSRIQTDYRLLRGSQNPNKTLLLEHLMVDCLNLDSTSFGL